MGKYGRSGGYGGRGGHGSRGGYGGGGFTNRRTGSYVSPTRAHQHTGQSIGGYTKRQSPSSGNWYMSKD